MTTEYIITVTKVEKPDDGPEKRSSQTVQGLPRGAAAWMHAIAEEIDPPRRPTRGSRITDPAELMIPHGDQQPRIVPVAVPMEGRLHT